MDTKIEKKLLNLIIKKRILNCDIPSYYFKGEIKRYFLTYDPNFFYGNVEKTTLDEKDYKILENVIPDFVLVNKFKKEIKNGIILPEMNYLLKKIEENPTFLDLPTNLITDRMWQNAINTSPFEIFQAPSKFQTKENYIISMKKGMRWPGIPCNLRTKELALIYVELHKNVKYFYWDDFIGLDQETYHELYPKVPQLFKFLNDRLNWTTSELIHAVRQNPDSIVDLEHRLTEEIIIACWTISKYPGIENKQGKYLYQVPITKKIIEKASPRQLIKNFKHIPDEFKTKEFCLKLLKEQNIDKIPEKLPKEFMTSEIWSKVKFEEIIPDIYKNKNNCLDKMTMEEKIDTCYNVLPRYDRNDLNVDAFVYYNRKFKNDPILFPHKIPIYVFNYIIENVPE